MLNATHAAGGDVHNSTNATTQSTSISANAQSALHSTGNPILALLAVSAVLGGAASLRRK